jgi:hypothetical protein
VPIQLDRLATNFRARVRLLDAGRNPVTGIAWNAAGIQVQVLSEAGTGFANQTLFSGTVGTYLSNSWAEIGDGWYQYCLPNSYIVPDTQVLIRARGVGTDPWCYGVVMMTGAKDLIMGQKTPADNTVGGQLDKIVSDSIDTEFTGPSNATRQFPTATTFAEDADEVLYAGSDWIMTFKDVGEVTITDKIEFAVKSDLEDTDDESVLTIKLDMSTQIATVTRLNSALVNYVSGVAMSYRDYLDPDDSLWKKEVMVFIRDSITSEISPATYHRGLKVVGNSRVLSQDTIEVKRPVVRSF